VAFGRIGLDRETFWNMTPREFFNAWIGWQESQSERLEAEFEAMRSIIYGAARYNAANTAFSGEASKAISRQKFPWEKQQPEQNDGEDILMPILSAISKPANNA